MDRHLLIAQIQALPWKWIAIALWEHGLGKTIFGSTIGLVMHGVSAILRFIHKSKTAPTIGAKGVEK